MEALLEITHLNVRIPVETGILRPVRDVSLRVMPGKILCIVGESGCGKSMTLLALLGLLPARAERTAETLKVGGNDLQTLSARAIENLRGRAIGMIFQDPMTAFNPTMTVGRQLEEVHLRHMRQGRLAAHDKALQLMRQVGVSSPESRFSQYPHELSGGLRQRMMIVMALMCDPMLLLADEPTTALDVTIQAQILALIKRLRIELNIGIVFITHDLGVVAAIADDIAVMYAGEIVETGTTRQVFSKPMHPYTRALFSCVPEISSNIGRRNLDATSGRSARLGTIVGRVPSLTAPLTGCAFAERCNYRVDACTKAPIPLLRVGQLRTYGLSDAPHTSPPQASDDNLPMSRCLFTADALRHTSTTDTLAAHNSPCHTPLSTSASSGALAAESTSCVVSRSAP